MFLFPFTSRVLKSHHSQPSGSRSTIQSADYSRERRATLLKLVKRTEDELVQIGVALGSARRDAASALRRDMTTALASLAMGGTRFDVSLSWEKIPVESSSDPWASSNVYVAEAAQEVGEDSSARYRLRNSGLDWVTFLPHLDPTNIWAIDELHCLWW